MGLNEEAVLAALGDILAELTRLAETMQRIEEGLRPQSLVGTPVVDDEDAPEPYAGMRLVDPAEEDHTCPLPMLTDDMHPGQRFVCECSQAWTVTKSGVGRLWRKDRA